MKTLAFLTLFLGFAFAANAQEKKEEKSASSKAMSAKELYHSKQQIQELKQQIQENTLLTPSEVQSLSAMLEKSPNDAQVLKQIKATLLAAAARKAGRAEKPTHE
jgi:DNA replication protein DnaD